MKYYLDAEFLEGTQRKTLFGIPTLGLRWDETGHLEIFKPQTKNTIDLISIGIVSEDGREYYAISKDFNLKEAWNRFDWKEHKSIHKEDEGKILNQKVYWIRENVLKAIFDEWKIETNGKIVRLGLPIPLNEMKFNYKNFKYCIKCIGKTNKQIAEEIVQFVDARWIEEGNVSKGFMYPGGTSIEEVKTTNIQFYAYYADYDWVVFCWLFGKMIDLPKGFPMYCRDLKQIADETWEKTGKNTRFKKGQNEHNALADAKWNKRLHEFLNTI